MSLNRLIISMILTLEEERHKETRGEKDTVPDLLPARAPDHPLSITEDLIMAS